MRPEFTRAFDVRPATFDSEALTVEVVFSTGAAVTRRDARGPYVERLDLDAINPADLIGLTVFADHVETTRSAVGAVTAARREGDALVGTIQLSRASDTESLRVKVAEGTVRGISTGYTVARWVDTTDASGRRVRTAAEWRIHEISLVGRPADPRSIIRSFEVEPNIPEPAVVENRAAIRAIARTAGLDSEWSDAQIDTGADVTAARAAAFEAMAARRPAIRASVGFSNDDPEVITRRMVQALAADAAGVPVEDQGAAQFRGAGFTGLARGLQAGQAGVTYMSDAAVIDAAMTRSGGSGVGTSDFPLIALGAGNRIVAHAYREAASAIESALVTYGTAPDFRTVTEVQRGGVGNLEPLTEHGEIKAVSTAEAGTSWSLGTYAARMDISRKLLVNDDLNLFGSIAADMGRAARRTETQAIVDKLTSNPVMADGVVLFHADHGNLAASGAALSDATLEAAMLAMQAQTGINGEIIGIRPAYLLVSPAKEITAQKLLAQITATTVDDVNPFAGRLELLVDPRLSGTPWYLFGKPSAAPVLKVAHLAGQSGPVVQMQERWTGLGMSWRVWTDFGVTVVDHRGGYKNAGA